MSERANDDKHSFDSAVFVAAKNGNLDDLVTTLTSRPHLIDTPCPHEWKQTPLFVAAMNGHVGVVEKLIELGSAAIDRPESNYGNTPMFGAARRGRVAVIEALVRLGSKAIDTTNKKGWSPLQAAVKEHQIECAKTLIWLGADRRLAAKMIRQIRAPVDEEAAAGVRYRVYFQQSLMSRLVVQLDLASLLLFPAQQRSPFRDWSQQTTST